MGDFVEASAVGWWCFQLLFFDQIGFFSRISLVHFCFDTRRKTCERRPLPGKLRVQSAGAIYHVMSRGDRRENVFPDDVDRHDFLKTLAETCQKTGFQVHAYCLMPNHFHLVVETPDANLVAGMAWLIWAPARVPTARFNSGCGTRPWRICRQTCLHNLN